MADDRRVVLWTVVSVGVAAAIVVPLLLWMLVFSPEARLRQTDARSPSAPDALEHDSVIGGVKQDAETVE